VAVEVIADWTPLEAKLPPELCAEFMWMHSEGGVEHYKHIVTRRYLRLDHSGRCLVATGQGLREVPFEQEWKHATGRAGGNDIHERDRSAGPLEGEHSEIGQRKESIKRSQWPTVSQAANDRPIFRRPARRRRQQAHPGTGSGKRTGGFGDRF
jgi:hypothetical protein